jgi:hypothetical protein
MWRGPLLSIFLLVGPAAAKDFRAQWVEAVNNVVQCKTSQNGWIFRTLGPCQNFRPPDTIAVGEKFSAGGELRIIRVITATQSEIDYKIDDWSIKKGEWWCVAAESLVDLDDKGSANTRTWLLIPKCIPVIRTSLPP